MLLKRRYFGILRNLGTRKRLMSSMSSGPIEIPKIDWDDWIKQYPSFSRQSAEKTIDEYKRAQTTYFFDAKVSETIDWSFWQKNISTPGLVDLMKADFESTDFTDYGPFYFDSLKAEARAKKLSSTSPQDEDEINAIGRGNVENGVEKTMQSDLKNRIDSAKELTEISALRLEELYKDKEQMDSKARRANVQSLSEEMAENPGVAREVEENLSGGPLGNGFAAFETDILRMVAIDQEREDWRDKETAENSLRTADDEIGEYLAILGRMNIEVGKKEYIAQKFKERGDVLRELRSFCKESRSINSTDPKTGESLTEEIKYEFAELRGGG